MMVSIRFFSFLLFLFFGLSAWSVSFDWSGWTRVEGYYQNSPNHNYYGNYHFVLNPSIHVMDGLSVTGRLDLSLFGETLFPASLNERQTGFVLTYADSEQKKLKSHQLFLRPSQIYMDYQNEFLKLRLGRAPFHFGLGVTYSASQDPFQHWMSVYNQAALYMEYSRFYFQPALLHHEFNDKAAPLLQAGILNEEWSLEALYQYDFKDNSFVEFFGKYEKLNWGLKGSALYGFIDNTNMLVALEAFIQVPFKVPFQVELKAGGAFGDSAFHPNYDLALLFWNRLMNEAPTASKKDTGRSVTDESQNPKQTEARNVSAPAEAKDFLQIASGQIQKGVYFSPRLLFSFLDDHLKIRPLLLLARDLDTKQFNYEFDLEGVYQWGESFFFSLKGGALYTKKLHLALLAQAAVSF